MLKKDYFPFRNFRVGKNVKSVLYRWISIHLWNLKKKKTKNRYTVETWWKKRERTGASWYSQFSNRKQTCPVAGTCYSTHQSQALLHSFCWTSRYAKIHYSFFFFFLLFIHSFPLEFSYALIFDNSAGCRRFVLPSWRLENAMRFRALRQSAGRQSRIPGVSATSRST